MTTQECKCHCHGGYCIKDCGHPMSCEHCTTTDEWGEFERLWDNGYLKDNKQQMKMFIEDKFIKKSTHEAELTAARKDERAWMEHAEAEIRDFERTTTRLSVIDEIEAALLKEIVPEGIQSTWATEEYWRNLERQEKDLREFFTNLRNKV